jgi:hypothetical protein
MIFSLLLVTIRAIKITVLCDDKGEALDIHFVKRESYGKEILIKNIINAYILIILIPPGHVSPLPGWGFPWNVRDK